MELSASQPLSVYDYKLLITLHTIYFSFHHQISKSKSKWAWSLFSELGCRIPEVIRFILGTALVIHSPVCKLISVRSTFVARVHSEEESAGWWVCPLPCKVWKKIIVMLITLSSSSKKGHYWIYRIPKSIQHTGILSFQNCNSSLTLSENSLT